MTSRCHLYRVYLEQFSLRIKVDAFVEAEDIPQAIRLGISWLSVNCGLLEQECLVTKVELVHVDPVVRMAPA